MINFFINKIDRLRYKRDQKIKHNWVTKTKNSFSCCGEGVVVKPYSNFLSPERIQVGHNVNIGFNGWFVAEGGLEIGDNTVISRNCTIYTASHNYEGELLPFDDTNTKKTVKIGANVWIGMNVMIIPGVSIGDGAIIGLGSIVTKDIPRLAIVGSQGHRILKYRNAEHYNKLKEQNRYINSMNHEKHYSQYQ